MRKEHHDDPQLRRLFAELDVFQTMLVAADRLEELGEADLARAWRLLASSRRLPTYSRGKYRWYCGMYRSSCDKLPRWVYDRMAAPRASPSVGGALRRAAAAVADGVREAGKGWPWAERSLGRLGK